jgi:UDP-N-acetylmuramate: L-alanyl-gamma-D-glutamyl-meso-diaminopimelate ligase
LTAAEIYHQSADKQRILITGGGSNLITSIVTYVLKYYHRKFDLAINGNTANITDEAPLILIEKSDKLFDYKHHMLVLGSFASDEFSEDIAQLADATPKAGTIIYPAANAAINKIGSKERTDVQAIPYQVYKHDMAEGKTVLISSTKERVPVELSGEQELMCTSAAKELLKKIGISSGQFYKAIGTYKPA